VTQPKKKILLIEDDEATLHLFGHYLEGEDSELFAAADGREGLDVARARKPDLVILDLMLPEIHGIGVCQALKGDPPTAHIKVLIVSVKGFAADRKQAAEAGADSFLAKPVSRPDFLAEVRRLLK
jgi:CheY-like chemotaxis protein